MNLDELWVGDFLRVRSSGQIGRFEAIKGQLVRIKLEKGYLDVEKEDIEPADDPHVVSSQTAIYDKKSVKEETSSFNGSSIDLHIEVLNPHMIDALPERIRDFQIEQCKAFLQYAITKRYASIEIIHGKGTGLLKKEIQHLLKLEPAVTFFLEKNQGGSTEVWLDPSKN